MLLPNELGLLKPNPLVLSAKRLGRYFLTPLNRYLFMNVRRESEEGKEGDKRDGLGRGTF